MSEAELVIACERWRLRVDELEAQLKILETRASAAEERAESLNKKLGLLRGGLRFVGNAAKDNEGMLRFCGLAKEIIDQHEGDKRYAELRRQHEELKAAMEGKQ